VPGTSAIAPLGIDAPFRYELTYVPAGDRQIVAKLPFRASQSARLNVPSGAVIDNVNFTFGATTFYRDADGDCYGLAASMVSACTAPTGYITQSGDCNDADPAVHPNESEICDGKDNDCDGVTDENCSTFRTYFAPVTVSASTMLLAVTVAPGGPSVQDVITFTFNGFITEPNFALGTTTIHVSLFHGDNWLTVDGISEGTGKHDEYVDVMVTTPGTSPLDVQRVSVPVGESVVLTITRP